MFTYRKNWFKQLFNKQSPAQVFKKNRAMRPRLESLEPREVPAILTVTNDNDSGLGSLRAAIILANSTAASDTIIFTREMTINLTTTGNNTIGPSAFAITTDITITGNYLFNNHNINLQGNNQRLFYVASGGNLKLTSLTLSDSIAIGGNGAGGGGGAAGMGGAIFVDYKGVLSMATCTLYNNQAVGGNGADGANGGGGGVGASHGGGAGGSGTVIIAFPDTFKAATLVNLTYTEPTRSGYRVYAITASSSGTITF